MASMSEDECHTGFVNPMGIAHSAAQTLGDAPTPCPDSRSPVKPTIPDNRSQAAS